MGALVAFLLCSLVCCATGISDFLNFLHIQFEISRAECTRVLRGVRRFI